jgi:2-polyprenyl-3-methyl-5-hydroxy-6-metoxy-1,4-benzoquinol methylase
MKNLFKVPPVIKNEGFNYLGYHSYSEYNYLQKSYITTVKKRHFEIALDLTSEYYYKANVIDFGCADGIFLPSLSNYFCSVVGIERNEKFVFIAQKLIDELNLKNVKIINNRDTTIQAIKEECPGDKYKIIFLLEVLEHVGNNFKTMYDDRITLLKELFLLVEDDGIIVISVPKMVGLSFLIQQIGLSLLNMTRSEYTLRELLMCSLLKDTSEVEKDWVPEFTHKGFNHEKFEEFMSREFLIKRKVVDVFQVVYVIGKRN